MLEAIARQGGIYMVGRFVPIWAVVIIEFGFAYALEMLMGSPLSFKLVCRVFAPGEIHPVLFESAIICTTVGLMCPAMSFIAAWLYYPCYTGFKLFILLADWLKLVCFNFPFAWFTQMFFIQPMVRIIFRGLFRKDIRARMPEKNRPGAQPGTV